VRCPTVNWQSSARPGRRPPAAASAQQAFALIAAIRPRDLVGQTRRRLAKELIGELEAIDKKIKSVYRELTGLVTARGPAVLELTGIGPSSAARLLADVGDIHRFADRGKFASWNGTAPLDASSGNQERHRLSRAGNRRINRALHIMAVVQLRNQTQAGPTTTRKAGGMPSMMAIRALKRRLSNVVFAQMLADQKRREAAGPGGQSGTALSSSVTDLKELGDHHAVACHIKIHDQPGLNGKLRRGPAGPARGRPYGPGVDRSWPLACCPRRRCRP
jgi:transposase